MHDEVTALLRPLARVATKLEPKKVRDAASLPITGSHFGGAPFAEAGEEWPVCPTCQTSLAFICQINTASGFHRPPEGVDLFTFFYCWECSPWGLSDEVKGTWVVRNYLLPDERKATLLPTPDEQPQPTGACEVLAERVLSFPDWDEIDSQSREAAEAATKANSDEPWEAYNSAVEALGGFTDYATVVGGYPRWVQGEATPDCESCKGEMRLLAQIDTEDEADIIWGDVGCVYIFYCPEHPKETKLELQCF
jgi:uncharacterized protein YwqG